MKRLKVDSGLTLTEILIAIVILGFAAIAILNGLSTDSRVQSKNSDRVSAFQSISSAAEEISGLEFRRCESGSSGNLYGSFPGVQVEVKELKLDNSGFFECDSAAEVVQQITLTELVTVQGKVPQTRKFLKTYQGPSSSGGTNPVEPLIITAPTRQSVKLSAPSTYNCGNLDSFPIENNADLSNVSYIASASTSNVSVSVSGDTVTVSGLSVGNAIITIQGVDPRNSTLSNALTLSAQVFESYGFTSPANQTFVSGFPRVLSLTGFVSAPSAVLPNLRMDFLDLSYSEFYNLTSSTGSFSIAPKSSTGVRATENIRLRISDNRVPLTLSDTKCATSNWRLTLTVNKPLEFSIAKAAGRASCDLSVFSTAPCLYNLVFESGSGSGSFLTGDTPTSGAPTVLTLTNSAIPYSGTASIDANSACLVVSGGGSGRIKDVRIASNGALIFEIAPIGVYYVGEKIRISNSSDSSLAFNSVSDGPVRVISLSTNPTAKFGSVTGSIIVTTNAVTNKSSLTNSQKNGFSLIPIGFDDYVPRITDNNFGSPYSVNSKNAMTQINCIDN